METTAGEKTSNKIFHGLDYPASAPRHGLGFLGLTLSIQQPSPTPQPTMEPETEPPQIQPNPTDSQTVEQCLGFLSRKDDTSRFVGLAILSSLITHLQDRAVLVRCWEALDPRFLDRLLKAGACGLPEGK